MTERSVSTGPARDEVAHLHPETKRLLDRRAFLARGGAAVGLTFLGMAVVGCSSSDSSSGATTSVPTTSTPPKVSSASLYDRLGGEAAVTAVVSGFLTKVAADERINHFFADTNIPRLQIQVVNLLGQATGGPQTYEGADMKAAHAGMDITVADFNAFVEDLVATLDAADVPAQEKQELLDLLAPMQSDIVTA